MKHWWLIPLIVGAAFALGRLTIKPKVVTETVVEYHSINTSAVAPSIVSEPIGTREVKVMLRKSFFPNINQVGDDKEDNFPIINQIGDSTEMVKTNSQPVTSCNGLDSATVELPIRDYTFTDDSTYTITARGVYVESLPQIKFKPRFVATTRTETVVRTPLISHGFQLGGGVAMTPQGLQPAIYFGYGFTIRF